MNDLGRISRRELLRWTGGVVVGGAAASLLAACGGGATQAAAPAATASGQPIRGGKLTIAVENNLASINPLHMGDWISMSALNNLFDTLLTIDPANKPRPLLAESWSATTDGQHFTFHLRKGVKFQDGTPVTSDAVKQNVLALQDPKNKAPQASDWTNLASIDTPDTNTVVFNWKLPTVIDDFFTSMVLSPFVGSQTAMANASQFNTHPVGAGPFQFKEYVADDHLTLSRFDGYWAGAPYLDTLEVRIMPDQATRRSAMLAGDVDVYINVPPVDVKALQAAGVQIIHGPAPNQWMISINLDNPILADVNVRKALAYAIDKKTIVQQVYAGMAYVATTLVPPYSPGFAKDIPGYGYDPQKSKQILQADGWTPGPDGILVKDGKPLELTMITQNDQTWVLVCRIVQQELAQIGIKVNLDIVDWATYLTNQRVGKFDISYRHLGGVSFEAYNYNANLLSTAYWNPSQMRKNPAMKGLAAQFDQLINSAQAELNDAKRNAIMHQFQQLIIDTVPVIPLWHTQQVTGVQNWVKGLEVPTMTPTVRCEKAWLAKH